MANTMKRGAERLREIAGTASPPPTPSPIPEPPPTTSARPTSGKDTVMIGGHFPRAWRRALTQAQLHPDNDGKKLNDLLAEALTDLFTKYGIPAPQKP
jgi:hypothetical protein